MKTMNIPYSVCMSVYRNDHPEHFRLALDSMINQSFPPQEVVVVQDGTVPQAISDILMEYTNLYTYFFVVTLDKNMGQGTARRIGLEHCHCDYIAIMDADDLALPNRMELQMNFLVENPQVDVLGGQIAEFIDVPENIVGYRQVPLTDNELKAYLKVRCPFNQMTVTFKKQSVLNAGSYQHWHYNEDYYLWIRMFLKGAVFANLSNELVRVRVGKEMYGRRGGWRYFKSEAKLQKYMLDHHVISFFRFMYNVIVRLIVQVLMTNGMRGFVFRKLFRKRNN